ncbi:PAAR-like domain-containing protein [Vannielia sp. SX4]|uniref:PAAR-like domain-containing protein n=1 Tax=Vannielia sp. SX4 TaxID=3463852 RepID=UPI0040583265
MPDEEEEEELQMSSSNLDDAVKGKTDTIIITSGKQGGRKVKGHDLPGALMQAGVKKDWQGTLLIAFPDVCKTPAPGGPVPIPYPNIAAAGPKQGKKVKVEQSLRQAGYKGIRVQTMGDEAGTAKGLVGAKAFSHGFTPFSFDVKAEGKGAMRLIGHEVTHAIQQSSHVPHGTPGKAK